MTLFEVTNILKQIALTQPAIKTADEGNIYDRMDNDPSIKYGVFFLSQNTHVEEEELDRYGFTFFYVDRLDDTLENNKLRIQSLGKSVLSNIINTFCDKFDVEFPEITYTPFTQKFVDECAGVYANILIDVYKTTTCEDEFAPIEYHVGVLQNKSMKITQNGDFHIAPDNGYDGLSYVDLEVDVIPTGVTMQSKDFTITGNGRTNITVDSGYDGITGGTILVDVSCDLAYQSGVTDGMAAQKALLSSTEITENGEYTSENGFSAVTVSVHPNTTDLTVSVNGEYTPSSGFIGYSAVTVNVNSGECNMQEFQIVITTDRDEVVTGVQYTVSYLDTGDTYTYNGEGQRIAVYPGVDYVISFGEYSHHIAPDSISGTSSWGSVKVIEVEYKYLSECYVDPESVSIVDTGGTGEISIVADGAWTASTTSNWFILSPTTGTGNGTITVSASENETGDVLEGVVSVAFHDYTTGTTVVSQNPIAYLEVDEPYILFEHSGSSYHLAVSSNTEYSITTPEWITYEYEDNLLKLTASDIGNTEGRHGKVTFTYGDYSKTIDVNQVHPDYTMFVYSGDTIETEYVSTGSLTTIRENVNGQVYVGSNCTNINLGTNIHFPVLKAFAIDIPTTELHFDGCNCSWNDVDYLTIPKNVRLPSAYYSNEHSAFGGNVKRFRVNTNLPRGYTTVTSATVRRGRPSMGFNNVELMEIGPDSTYFGEWSFIKNATSASGNEGGVLGYKYTSYTNNVVKYGYAPVGEYYSRNTTNGYRFYFEAYAGLNKLKYTGSIGNFWMGNNNAKYYWIPNTQKVEQPPYINERFV